MRAVIICLLSLLIASSSLLAEKYNTDMYFSNVGPVFVQISDNATGGCWTNLKEVKTYASNKIELAGGTLADTLDASKGVWFHIHVFAMRHSEVSMCLSKIDVNIQTVGTADHLPFNTGLLNYSNNGQLGLVAGNVNTIVLDVVKETVDEWTK